MKRVLVFVSLFFVVLCPVRASDQPPIDRLQSLKSVQYHLFKPQELDRTYHIFVRLPASHGDPDKTYPTIYLLDGGITFPLMASYYRYLELSGTVPEAILVGLSYGTADWRKGNMRSTDFTAPAEGRAHYGGADAFLTFFEEELFPFIEGSYASDSNERIIFGQSLGGQFVLHALLKRPDLFTGYIASNPALHRNLELFLPAVNNENRKTAVRLYVSSGENDETRFRAPALQWMKAWQDEKAVSWHWLFETLSGQNHFSAAPEAFRRGINWVLKSPE